MSWFASLKSIISIWKFWRKGDVDVDVTDEGIELNRRVNKTTKERLKIKIGEPQDEENPNTPIDP